MQGLFGNVGCRIEDAGIGAYKLKGVQYGQTEVTGTKQSK